MSIWFQKVPFNGYSFSKKIYDDFLKGFDNGKFVGAVFIDLRKAFDTVDHGILLKKLVAYGVEGRDLGWFKSYLSNHIQQVNFK